MRICIKVTVWEEFELHPEEDLTKEELISLVKENQNDIIDLVYNKKDWDPESEILLETEHQMMLDENDGFSTVEVYDDDLDLIYENGK